MQPIKSSDKLQIIHSDIRGPVYEKAMGPGRLRQQIYRNRIRRTGLCCSSSHLRDSYMFRGCIFIHLTSAELSRRCIIMSENGNLAKRVSVVCIVGNIILCLFKLAAGIIASSGAMVSSPSRTL